MTAEIIEFDAPPKMNRKCSFCGKPEAAVKTLISNNEEGKAERTICNLCLEKATRLLERTES